MKISNHIFLLTTLPFLSNCQVAKEKHINNSSDKRYTRISKRKHFFDSINKAHQWKEIKPKLWMDKNGVLGIKTSEANAKGIDFEFFITALCCDGKSIKSVIDTASFQYLGSSFFKDKNQVYTHYKTACGGSFWIVKEADPGTFRVIGDCYAKDKNHIYSEREMILDSVDYKTFKTKKGIGCFAKDKNGYYFWDRKLDSEDLQDSLVRKKVLELDNL